MKKLILMCAIFVSQAAYADNPPDCDYICVGENGAEHFRYRMKQKSDTFGLHYTQVSEDGTTTGDDLAKQCDKLGGYKSGNCGYIQNTHVGTEFGKYSEEIRNNPLVKKVGEVGGSVFEPVAKSVQSVASGLVKGVSNAYSFGKSVGKSLFGF